MFRLSRLRFPAETIIPAHSHTGFELCLLVRGQLKMWSSFSGHSRLKVLNAGCCWIAGSHTEHSVLITEDSQSVRLELGLSLLKHTPQLRAVRRSLVIGALFTIQASRACSPSEAQASTTYCDYGLAELERDQQSGLQFTVPDCFFNSLESAAAGGDTQAQVELGITLMQGLSPNPGDAMLGPYWLKRAAASGHPSAQTLLDAYMEDISC